MADLLHSGNGAERLANALLHSNGGSSVLLRVAAPATAGNDAEQLGLATPQFQDVPLALALWRRTANETQLLLSATAVRTIVGTLNVVSAEALFAAATGIVADGVLFGIVALQKEEAKGDPFCYRLTVRPPQL